MYYAKYCRGPGGLLAGKCTRKNSIKNGVTHLKTPLAINIYAFLYVISKLKFELNKIEEK